MKNGGGTMDWPDGSWYIGNFRNDKINGYGIFYHSDGDKYEGEWI